MSLGENSLVAAYQGKGQLKSRPSGRRVVTFIGGSGGIRDPTRKRLTEYTADTKSNEKETDTRETRSIEKLCQRIYCDWRGYDIQRVRDLFRDSADYEIQRTNISLCSKRLVWRCGAEIKRHWRTQRDFILR